MKNIRLSAAILALLMVGQITVYAQKMATWQGGAPGRSTDWACAQNWKEGRTPNEFSDVVIPDVSTTSGFPPIIRTEVERVNSLRLLASARLRIEKTGALEVLEFVEIQDANSILNAGTLQLPVPALQAGNAPDTIITADKF